MIDKLFIKMQKMVLLLMWNSSSNIDKDLVGKHVDELAEMLEKNATSRNVYLEFEAHVHVGLLKKILIST